MVLYIPTHSHFTPPHPVPPSIFHTLHSSSSSPSFHLTLPRHPSPPFIRPSAPLLLRLPGKACFSWVCAADLMDPCWAPRSPCLSSHEPVKPPEKSWKVRVWSQLCSGSVLFSEERVLTKKKNFPSRVTAVVFSSLSRCFYVEGRVCVWVRRAQPSTAWAEVLSSSCRPVGRFVIRSEAINPLLRSQRF